MFAKSYLPFTRDDLLDGIKKYIELREKYDFEKLLKKEFSENVYNSFNISIYGRDIYGRLNVYIDFSTSEKISNILKVKDDVVEMCTILLEKSIN
eukprot:UN28244